LKQQAVNHFK